MKQYFFPLVNFVLYVAISSILPVLPALPVKLSFVPLV